MPKPTKRAQKRNKKLRMQKPESTKETMPTNSASPTEPGVGAAPAETPVEGTREVPFGAKAQFIRSQPYDIPASVVMERALAAGIKLSENHIYATRQRTKADGKGRREATHVVEGNPSSKQQLLEQLEAIIFRIGYDDAEAVFLRMKREHHI